MFKKNILKIKGFTLVETLVYTAIISLLASAFVSFGFLMFELRIKSVAMGEINAGAKNSLDIISEKIRSAESIDSPALAATSSVLVLNMPDLSVFTIELLGNSLVLLGDDGQNNITNSNVILSDLEFLHISSGNGSSIVKFNFNIKYNDGTENYQKLIQSAVNLRK